MTQLESELDQAEQNAWEALARYKFIMFGYWCAIWVHLNRAGEFKRDNPWKPLVDAAKWEVAARNDLTVISLTPSVAATASEAP